MDSRHDAYASAAISLRMIAARSLQAAFVLSVALVSFRSVTVDLVPLGASGVVAAFLVVLSLAPGGGGRLVRGSAFALALAAALAVASSLQSPYTPSVQRVVAGMWFAFAAPVAFLLAARSGIEQQGLAFVLRCSLAIVAAAAFSGVLERVVGGPSPIAAPYAFAWLSGMTGTTANTTMYPAVWAYFYVLALTIWLGRRGMAAPIVLVVALAGVLLTGSRKSLVALLGVTVLFALSDRRLRLPMMVGLSIVVAILVPIAGPQLLARFADLSIYVDPSVAGGVARSAMLLAATVIAVQLFPLGVGLGLFGSVPAANNYSPVYFEYGLDAVHGLGMFSAERGENFLVDTLWPQLLGEQGALGFLIMCGIILYPAAHTRMRSFARSPDAELRSFAFFVRASTLLVVVESFGSPIYQNPFGVLMHSVLCGFAVGCTEVRGRMRKD